MCITKGSKYWMRECSVNLKLKSLLDRRLDTQLEWIFPTSEDYHEHELRTVCKMFGMTADQINKLFSFWPQKQPLWDGIAIDKNNTLFLFEAKAHSSEYRSSCRASEKSKQKIIDSMRIIHREYYPQGDFTIWVNGCYQFANRLTFLHMIGDKLLPQINKVTLVYVGFANDRNNIPTSMGELEATFYSEWEKISGMDRLDPRIKYVAIDIKNFSK